MDSLQKTTLPNVYFSPSSTGENYKTNMDIENDKYNMLQTILQQNVHSTTKIDEVLPTSKHDMYLPPDAIDSPITNESEGYSYEKPSNQFTLPNENNKLEHIMNNTQWYPSISSGNDDDSVEVFPPTESPYATWAVGNAESQNYKPKAEAQVYTEAHDNYLRQNNQEHRTEDLKRYNNDRLKFNSKVSLPTTKTEHDSLLNSPYTFPSNNNDVKSDKSVELIPQVSPLKNSKMVKNVNNDEFQPAQTASSDREAKIDELSETSLMVHFAGSVFSADGLPHPSKEMVGKTGIYFIRLLNLNLI